MNPYQTTPLLVPKQLETDLWGAILRSLSLGEPRRFAGRPAPPTMAKAGDISILLIRSGATEWDDAGRLQGDTDLPLSEAGRQRLIHDLAAFSASTGRTLDVAAVLHGPDDASRDSAALVSRAFSARRREIPDLRAVGLGLWEGMRAADLLDRQPTAFRHWLEDPAAVTAPEGEAFADAHHRLTNALSRAFARAGKRTLAVVLRPVAHGVIRCWLAGLPPSDLCRTSEDAPSFESLSIPRSALAAPYRSVRLGA